MIGTRQDAQVLYSALTFRSLLDALARPGKTVQLPPFPVEKLAYNTNSADMHINTYALGAMLTLLDRETSFLIADAGCWLEATDPLMQWVTLRSGSNVAPPDQAAFALLCDAASGELIHQLSQGTLLEPELSATALLCIEQIVQDVDDSPSEALTLDLRGPGIEERQCVAIWGLREELLNAIVVTRRSYPLGIDVYLVDAQGRCIGLPRTTRITWSR